MTEELETIRGKLLDFELHGITEQQKAVLSRAIAVLKRDVLGNRDAFGLIRVQDMEVRLNALVPGEHGVEGANTQDNLGGNDKLIEEVEAQKSLMIAVSTGGPRIQEKNQEYLERRSRIKSYLARLKIDDPNPCPDLWAWYGKWSDGDLPSYQSRRKYISDLYQPLLDYFATRSRKSLEQPQEATGWAKVDRIVDSIKRQIESGKNEEDFQGVGLLCREALISLGQSVDDATVHASPDGVVPSRTDANRMLQAFFEAELAGSSNEATRKLAKAALALANELQHKQTATFREAALCAEATRSVINLVAVLSGKRNP